MIFNSEVYYITGRSLNVIFVFLGLQWYVVNKNIMNNLIVIARCGILMYDFIRQFRLPHYVKKFNIPRTTNLYIPFPASSIFVKINQS